MKATRSTDPTERVLLVTLCIGDDIAIVDGEIVAHKDGLFFVPVGLLVRNVWNLLLLSNTLRASRQTVV